MILASNPVSMVNHISTDLGIPNRFNQDRNRSRDKKMVRIATIKWLAASIFLTCGAVQTLAADKLFPEDSPQVVYGDKRQAFGTGWYLRGDVAWSRDSLTSLSADGTFDMTPIVRNLTSLSVGFGYQISKWFRVDVTGDWRSPLSARRTSAGTFDCPLEVRGLTSIATGLPVGIYAVQNQCRTTESAILKRGVFLANGYFDLGTWSGVTPYVGAGVGLAYGRVTGGFDWIDTANNSSYRGNLVAPGGFPIIWMDQFGNPAPAQQFGEQRRARSLSQTRFNLAWAIMAGFAVDVSPNAKLVFGYRFLNMGKWGNSAKANTAHDFRMGFRYGID
jgi:opacity protein-like surface antigen